MKLKSIVLLFSALIIMSNAPKQGYKITGVVTDGTSQKLAEVQITIKNTNTTTKTNQNGEFEIWSQDKHPVLVFTKDGFSKIEKQANSTGKMIVVLFHSINDLIELDLDVEVEEELAFEMLEDVRSISAPAKRMNEAHKSGYMNKDQAYPFSVYHPEKKEDTEDYANITENGFQRPSKTPLSTFSIDVDAASYSNVRRFLNNGQLPPVDAVRIEEMINYFTYDYKQPKSDHPFSINTEVSSAPWNEKHQLVHIGLQGKKIATENLPASNLVFLLDVSGSMNAPNKLPLLKAAFRLLVEQLRPEDKVSIVVYAGAAGMVLEPTSGKEKTKILTALENLQAGGSTAGGAGIELAYAKAKEHFIVGGNNRVILATDGDFNVGASGNDDMEKLIEKKRNDGIYLTALGFGMGNYKDAKMEILADKGNGNYAYIDNIQEAKKVLVNEFGGTMFTIAKDVKIQVEFNPQNVQAYRLIGYENRKLNDEDFNNDQKDAGELGAGHTVTALYEIIPVGVDSHFASVDPLKYQKEKDEDKTPYSDEWMTVKLRYKKPEGDQKSKLISTTIKKSDVRKMNPGENFNWSSAVAAYGMILRNSPYKNEVSHEEVIALAESARGEDKEGYRAEFIRLMKSSNLLTKSE